jgi:hypothetical protein
MRAPGAGVEPIYFWPQAAWQVLFCARQGWKQTVVVSCIHLPLQATSVHLAKQATFLASHCDFLQACKSILHLSKQASWLNAIFAPAVRARTAAKTKMRMWLSFAKIECRGAGNRMELNFYILSYFWNLRTPSS